MTETTGSTPESSPEAAEAAEAPEDGKHNTLRESVVLIAIALVLYYLVLTFVARPYLIPSESMEPTLHGCHGCVGDRIMVDKVTYRFGTPQPGDVVVFRGPPSWNVGYKSIRSTNTPVRWVQNALSFIGFVPPDENDLVKRVIAVGGQTVQCRNDTGLTVDRYNEITNLANQNPAVGGAIAENDPAIRTAAAPTATGANAAAPATSGPRGDAATANPSPAPGSPAGVTVN